MLVLCVGGPHHNRVIEVGEAKYFHVAGPYVPQFSSLQWRYNIKEVDQPSTKTYAISRLYLFGKQIFIAHIGPAPVFTQLIEVLLSDNARKVLRDIPEVSGSWPDGNGLPDRHLCMQRL